MHEDADRLQPTLEEAEATLKASLAEVRALDPERADTGELIRLEEMLSIASDAAKRAVSVRRRLSERRRAPQPAPPLAGPGEAPGARGPAACEGHDAVTHRALVHRTFTDPRGTAWSVWSVHPSPQKSSTSALGGTFSQGWLAFECDVERRRLSPIPEDWERLDEAGLLRLWEVAAPAPKNRRPCARKAGTPAGTAEG